MATRGHGDSEVERTYVQARELCQRVGETPKLFPILWGLSRVYNAQGKLQASRDLGEQLLSTAQRLQDPALLLEAHHTLWAILFTLGDLDAAQKHAEYGIANYNQQQSSTVTLHLFTAGTTLECALAPMPRGSYVCWDIQTRLCREAGRRWRWDANCRTITA
jgi:tetratricopeptide (TPR) repeat protein